jgi:hypothetical protein
MPSDRVPLPVAQRSELTSTTWPFLTALSRPQGLGTRAGLRHEQRGHVVRVAGISSTLASRSPSTPVTAKHVSASSERRTAAATAPGSAVPAPSPERKRRHHHSQWTPRSASFQYGSRSSCAVRVTSAQLPAQTGDSWLARLGIQSAPRRLDAHLQHARASEHHLRTTFVKSAKTRNSTVLRQTPSLNIPSAGKPTTWMLCALSRGYESAQKAVQCRPDATGAHQLGTVDDEALAE